MTYMLQLVNNELISKDFTMYKPLHEYVEISGKVYQLYMDAKRNKKILWYNGAAIWYNEGSDGTRVDEVQVKDKYPEWFI